MNRRGFMAKLFGLAAGAATAGIATGGNQPAPKQPAAAQECQALRQEGEVGQFYGVVVHTEGKTVCFSGPSAYRKLKEVQP